MKYITYFKSGNRIKTYQHTGKIDTSAMDKAIRNKGLLDNRIPVEQLAGSDEPVSDNTSVNHVNPQDVDPQGANNTNISLTKQPEINQGKDAGSKPLLPRPTNQPLYSGYGPLQRLDAFVNGAVDYSNQISSSALGAAGMGALVSGGSGAAPGLALSVMSQVASAPFRVYQGVRDLFNGQTLSGIGKFGEATLDFAAGGLGQAFNEARAFRGLDKVNKNVDAFMNNPRFIYRGSKPGLSPDVTQLNTGIRWGSSSEKQAWDYSKQNETPGSVTKMLIHPETNIAETPINEYENMTVGQLIKKFPGKIGLINFQPNERELILNTKLKNIPARAASTRFVWNTHTRSFESIFANPSDNTYMTIVRDPNSPTGAVTKGIGSWQYDVAEKSGFPHSLAKKNNSTPGIQAQYMANPESMEGYNGLSFTNVLDPVGYDKPQEITTSTMLFPGTKTFYVKPETEVTKPLVYNWLYNSDLSNSVRRNLDNAFKTVNPLINNQSNSLLRSAAATSSLNNRQ